MSIDNPAFSIFQFFGTIPVFKIGFILFAALYFIFSLIVIRQVNMMTETIITEGGPILKIIAFLHTLLALGVLVYFIWFF